MSGMQCWAHPGLAAGYHLIDVNDFSGGAKTLTNNGTVTFGPGKFGDCALLGSSNSSKYLSRADGLDVNLGGSWGLSIWVRALAQPGSGAAWRIVDWRSTTGTARYFFLTYNNSSGTYSVRFGVGQATEGLTVVTQTLTTGIWYKIDITNDGSNSYLYINGVYKGSCAEGSNSNATNKIAVGAENGGLAGYYFSGGIDEAVFFSYSRTAQEIRRRYAFEKGMLV